MLQQVISILNISSDFYGNSLLVLMLVVTTLIIAMGLVRLYFLSQSHQATYSKDVIGNPKISIHLPVCNEPPKLVIKTIKSVENLDYRNFELLVISNNTSDGMLWKPVDDYIKKLDKRFKFIHIEKIDGYKAGALNLALNFTCVDASYIFTLDADYVLNANSLSIALGSVQNLDVQLLQFPQAYRNISSETSGIEINYKHYFDCYLSNKKSSILALPTGTLTLIDKKVFDNGFLWPTDSITEDASLGVELVQRNMSLAFCNYVIGRGTMPTESSDYSKQFKRWVFGNFQVLAKVWATKGISLASKIHLSTLLTAWINLLGVVFVIALASLPLLFLHSQCARIILLLGIANVILHCVIQLLIYRKIAANDVRKAWNGFLVHLGLLEIGSFYWMTYFISKKKPFVRTNKFISKKSSTNRLYLFPLLFLAVSAICFLLNYHIIAILIGLFGIQLLYAKFHKDQELVWSKFNFYKIQ